MRIESVLIDRGTGAVIIEYLADEPTDVCSHLGYVRELVMPGRYRVTFDPAIFRR